MEGKISIRQAGILIFFCILSNKLLLLPSLFFERVNTDGLISMAIAFAVELIFIPLFIALKKKYPDKSFYEVLKDKISLPLTKIIFIALMIFMIIKALLTFSIVYVYFKQEIYQEEFLPLILICMIPVISHGVMTGLRTISRTMEFFFAFVVAGFIICLSMSLFTPTQIPAFFVSGAKDILSTSFKYFIVFDDFIFLYLILNKIDIQKGKISSIYKYIFAGIFLILLLFFLFYAKYPVTAFMHDNALSDIMVFSVEFNAIGRLDIIAMITIMLITLFQMEIYSYGFCQCFEEIFPALDKKYGIVILDLVIVLMFTLFVGNHENIVSAAGGWFSILALALAGMIILLNILLLFTRRKHEKED